MRTWTTRKHVAADPAVVLDLLTDTDACRRWAPVPFELDGPAAGRLQAGTRVRVSGSLVGRRVGFDVEVHEAGDGRPPAGRRPGRRRRPHRRLGGRALNPPHQRNPT
jgi:hypothetical protein